MLEQIANKGNGNYIYIDSFLEAKKVLVHELGGTLETIAKDVKIQVEFNPVKVKSYRLIGYENRLLASNDFDDDKKDAGELGAGHSVTALYEIELETSETVIKNNLIYQKNKLNEKALSGEDYLTVKIRYKNPNETLSRFLSFPHKELTTNPSENFRFSSAVAEFSMLLRGSKYKANSSFDQVIEIAKESRSNDEYGYRGEFINLVESAKYLYE